MRLMLYVQFGFRIGHNDFPGCFRCHDDNHHTSKDGHAIKQDCELCHAIS
jgi:hypothetical protein